MVARARIPAGHGSFSRIRQMAPYVRHLMRGSWVRASRSERHPDPFIRFCRIIRVTDTQADKQTQTHAHTTLHQSVCRNSVHLAVLAVRAMRTKMRHFTRRLSHAGVTDPWRDSCL